MTFSLAPLAPLARRVAATLTALALTLTLSGCIKVELDSTVMPDDTVSGSITAAIRHEAVEVIGAAQAEEFVATLTTEVPGAYRTEPYDDGRFVGTTTYFERVSLAEFSNRGSEETEAVSLRIVHTGERYRLDGEWRLPDIDITQAVPQLDESVLASAEFTVSVTFPGEVVEHNGALSGKTVTWRLETGRTHVLHAESLEAEAPKVARTVLWVMLVVVVIAMVALYIQLRRYSIGKNPSGGHRPGTDRV